MALFAPEDTLVQRARAVVGGRARREAHVFNLGHGISRYTDPDQVELLVDTVHAA